MLVALSFALVFGAGEAQAQGKDGVSRGGEEPAGEVTGKADAPVDSGSAPRSTGGPASEDAPAHATPQAKSEQAVMPESDHSPGRSSARDPRDQAGSHGQDSMSARTPSRSSGAKSPPTTESTADPSPAGEVPPPTLLTKPDSSRASDNKPFKGNKLARDEKPANDNKPARDEKPPKELIDPTPEPPRSEEAEEPARVEQPVFHPTPDPMSDTTSEPPADPAPGTPPVPPSTSSESIASGPPTTEFGSETAPTGSTTEPGAELVSHSAGSAPDPEPDASQRVEPGTTPLAGEPALDLASETVSAPTSEHSSESVVTDLATEGPPVPRAMPSVTERWATGMSQVLAGALDSSSELATDFAVWVGDLGGGLARALEWLSSEGGEAPSPRGDPFIPLSGHSPAAPAPPAPIPVGGSAPANGFSFSGASSSGHASKQPLKEFGALVSLPIRLLQGGKPSWPSHDPPWSGSAQQHAPERPG